MYALFFLAILLVNSAIHTMDTPTQMICKPSDENAINKRPGELTKWRDKDYKIVERIEQPITITIVAQRTKHQMCGMPIVVEYITRHFNKATTLCDEGTPSYDLSAGCSDLLLATTAASGFLISMLFAITN